LSQPEIIEVQRNYQECIIALSHGRYFIRQVCDKVYKLAASADCQFLLISLHLKKFYMNYC